MSTPKYQQSSILKTPKTNVYQYKPDKGNVCFKLATNGTISDGGKAYLSSKRGTKVNETPILFDLIRRNIAIDDKTSAQIRNEPAHDKTNKMACAPSEDTDQTGHPRGQRRLIRLEGCPG